MIAAMALAAALTCTGGDFDYGTHAPPAGWAQADWETLSSCSTQIRPHIVSDLGINYYGGWVKALELNTRATAGDGTGLRFAEIQARFTGQTAMNCIEIYPVHGSWHSC